MIKKIFFVISLVVITNFQAQYHLIADPDYTPVQMIRDTYAFSYYSVSQDGGIYYYKYDNRETNISKFLQTVRQTHNLAIMEI